MKLKFDPTLDYQQQAVAAVIGVLDGQPLARTTFEISSTDGGGFAWSELGVKNNININDTNLLANVHKIQATNGIEKTPELQGRQFSIEMETGTGKTYIYLRTIFELAKTYGLRKFIIVVPSIAVREGVRKSIEMTKAHFQALYDNEPFEHFVYDSKKLGRGRVRQFAVSAQIQIMVINIQSFRRDITDKDTADMSDEELKKLNIINRENDRMSGRKPIEFIQATNPVVIIDEPQSVDNTKGANNAIEKLNPVFTLRYSATHRKPYNLLYKLDPIRAYDLRLVKRIEVASVREDGESGNAYVKLLKTDNKKSIRAQVEFYKESGGDKRQLWIKNGDDLYDKSAKHEVYRNGYIVNEIDCTPGAEFIGFNNGQRLNLGQSAGGMNDEIMQQQVYITVEEHLKKELACKGKGIKVLSLFFIDRVANYRIYNDDGTITLGKIGQWFEDAYKKLTAQKMYKAFADKNMAEIHGGYFSQDKGRIKDTGGNSKDDDDTYNLIMRDKERLLSAETPLRFIFSHSALREGWDNPNVFQICTLNETRSPEKKRQEIGRGLRLPVNEAGERVRDESVNRLTVIANESYEEFANALQNEFEQDYGIRFGVIEKHAFAGITRNFDGDAMAIGKLESAKIWKSLQQHGYIANNGKVLDKFNSDSPALDIGKEHDDINAAIIDVIQGVIFRRRIKDTRKMHKIKFNKQVQLSPEFTALWDKIKHRTRYRVSYKTEKLIQCAVARIKAMEKIKPVRVITTKGGIGITNEGVSVRILKEGGKDFNGIIVLPDLLAYLQKHTELTRHTLVEIINRCGRINEFQGNPQKFMAVMAHEISRALHDLILEGIQYEKVKNHYWQMCRLEKDAENGISRYLNNLYKVQNQKKSIVDHIEFDSEVERKFAEDLDNRENIRLFVKLPAWFKIDTPIGSYNPDWAFMTENNEKLYFVRETKGSTDDINLRGTENQKITCGKRHFYALGVDYGVVTNLSEVEF